MLYNYNLIGHQTNHRHSVAVTILVYGLYRTGGRLELTDRPELPSRES